MFGLADADAFGDENAACIGMGRKGGGFHAYTGRGAEQGGKIGSSEGGTGGIWGVNRDRT